MLEIDTVPDAVMLHLLTHRLIVDLCRAVCDRLTCFLPAAFVAAPVLPLHDSDLAVDRLCRTSIDTIQRLLDRPRQCIDGLCTSVFYYMFNTP